MEYYYADMSSYCFDFGWKFTHSLPSLRERYTGDFNMYVATRTGERCPAAKAGYDDSSWRPLDLPHDWLTEVPFEFEALNSAGFVPRETAWYRKEFGLDESCRGKSVILDFDGIAGHSEIYVNGSLIERNFSSYNSVAVDITDRVFFGDKANCIAVYIDRKDIELWAYEGAGIYRHVNLLIKDPVHIALDGIWAKSRIQKNGDWLLTAEVTVENSSYSDEDYTVSLTVSDCDSNIVAEVSGNGIAPGDGKNISSFELTVPSPALWTPDSPMLYRVSAVVGTKNGCDTSFVNHGFREFIPDADHGFILNGKPFRVNGICCHQEHAGVGIAVPDSIIEFRIKKLKELGINAYRCAHHRPSASLLDICDRLGMMVMDENRNFETGSDYIRLTENMVIRDRNHPSVVFYSVFNEEPIAAEPEGRKIYLRIASAIRKLDDTRILTGAMNELSAFAKDGVGPILDSTGINYSIENLDRFRAEFPDQPFYGSENSATFGTRGQFENKPLERMLICNDTVKMPFFNTVRETCSEYFGRPYTGGAFVWSGFDYRGESCPDGWPAVGSQFGLMDSCGFKKGGYYYLNAWLNKDPMIKILAHWNHKDGDTVTVYTVTNCDEVELFLNGKSLGKRVSELDKQLDWTVVFEKGTLRAAGYKDGKKVTEDSVVTTGKPTKLVLSPYRDVLTADGADTVSVTVSAVDENGNTVPTADNSIKFTVSGAGCFSGCGNGDPTSHEIDAVPERKLFAGLCAVLVRASKEAGEITVTAEAEGLESANAVLRVISAI